MTSSCHAQLTGSTKDIKPNPPFECRFNVTSSLSNVMTGNGTEAKSWIHSGVIRNTDVPDKLLNYTKQFNVSLECIWNITVMPGWKIYLTFSNYELNKPNDCDSNFIEIYEENLTEENQTVKFCGTRTEPQTSKSNVFNIRHHALPTASTSRFEIIYTAFREKGQGGACDARTEFDCDDGTCIHESLRCDGLVNCKYRYDENSDPGPCPGSDPDSPFFETEHMVIILIVFLTLVSGMCASIIVSCWGKIQERRRRKLDYHIRKSREASMEGQLNEVDQMVYGSTNDRSSGPINKQRIGVTANAVAMSENHLNPVNKTVQKAISAVSCRQARPNIENEQELMQQQNFIPGVQYQPHPLLGQMLVDKGNYGVFVGQPEQQKRIIASNSSSDVRTTNGFRDEKQFNFYGSRPKIYDSSSSEMRKSQQNSQQSLMSSMAAAQMKGHQNFDPTKQQPVPDISYNNQMKMKSGFNMKNQVLSPISNMSLPHNSHHQRQLLNFPLNCNQPIQHQQSLINSIYQQRQFQQDNETNNNNNDSNNLNVNNDSSNNNNDDRSCNLADNTGLMQGSSTETAPGLGNLTINQGMAGYLHHQQNFATDTPGCAASDHAASGANMIPMSLANYNNLVKSRIGAQTGNTSQMDEIQKLNYDNSVSGQLVRNLTYNLNRALTLSTIHQPLFSNNQQRNPQAIYGYNVNQTGQPLGTSNLSSSISCCNALGDFANETPLLNDLLVRANQQYRLNDDQELRSLTMVPRLSNAPSFPRSLSAYQLSRAQVRQSQSSQLQQLQRLYLQQRHEDQQQQQQQQPPPPPHHQQQTQQQQQQQAPNQQQQQELARQQQSHHQQQLQYKSLSDAGRANRQHQPPNHSLSYPHACSGAHMAEASKVGAQSPAIPPPPPPPNLAHVRAAPTASGALSVSNQPIDGRRAAFKVSRLDPSQVTGDTLQESDVPGGNMAFGSMQIDEPSTESEVTFGLLMNSIGNTSMNFSALGNPMHSHPHLNSSQQNMQRRLPLQAQYNQRSIIADQNLRNLNQTPKILTHLDECNFIRQRAALAANRQDTLVNQPLICDCGALERANHVRLQQLQVTGSSHEFDDSDDSDVNDDDDDVDGYEMGQTI